eukprot:TRINITY_DN29394_c0_g1_i1.p2 TRINITY_DN29394_c0_g1~~TRINITY_DN29394_c0_g1_i1.p2  ORF type:complete len:104 (+),score=10.11 TRINITY_DN29394_c0_g1_i1:185-496(+)
MEFSDKQYELKDWLIACAVIGGTTEFPMMSLISCSSGFTLAIGFLVLDGFTTTFWDNFLKKHVISEDNQMVYINVGPCLASLMMLRASGLCFTHSQVKETAKN